MPERLLMGKVAPEAYKKVFELHAYAQNTVNPALLELIKLRASMLNGCSYCVDLHSKDALKAGESSQRLFAVSVWPESPFFTPEERATLALTDAVTKIGEAGVPDDVWDTAREFYSDKELADIVMAIIMINAFNRIAISTHQFPTLDA